MEEMGYKLISDTQSRAVSAANLVRSPTPDMTTVLLNILEVIIIVMISGSGQDDNGGCYGIDFETCRRFEVTSKTI